MYTKLKTSEEIRRDFLDFFRGKEHEVVAGVPIVPQNDPTLMFVNAGMNQFKDVFLEIGSRDYKRATDTQRCLRVSGKHNDLEEVGVDTYHHTLFEMLGNWSFGDYFKKEAISWAMELLVDKWGLDPDRLYATVHEGEEKWQLAPDHEAAELWKSETVIDQSHILYCPSKDNFWMMGDTGPCGPCSEIHVDLRSEADRAEVDGFDLVNADHPEVIEIWNLVFIQYNCKEDGSLEPLANKHVDTGMGLERTVAVLQGKSSTYDTDLFAPILHKISELTPLDSIRGYNDIDGSTEEVENARIAMRVIADHIRTICFAIADGAVPSNEGRGYVIRRILRRAVRYGYDTLKLKKPFLTELFDPLVSKMGKQFPELEKNKELILKVIESEEQSFLKTLVVGIAYFKSIAPKILELAEEGVDVDFDPSGPALALLNQAHGNSRDEFLKAAKNGTLSGDITFLLHDTYGFPVDLTQLMASEKGLSVDIERYQELMTEQKDRARKHSAFSSGEAMGTGENADSFDPTVFIGYSKTKIDDAKILGVVSRDGEDGVSQHVVLDRTPFYAESGGQIGDTGFLTIDGVDYRVVNTSKIDSVYFHEIEGEIELGKSSVLAKIDESRRKEIAKHHSSTHILHAALRDALGDHVAQKGSLVTDERLRFDFSHFEGLSKEELSEIERVVNLKIQENLPALIEEEIAIDEAKERGAMMLFGEKYGDSVRVVTFDPDYSVELCGGIHVKASGEIGLFRFVSESSIAAGIRRVEAIAGLAAYESVLSQASQLNDIGSKFKSSEESLADQVEKSLEKNKVLEKEIAQLNQRNALENLDAILSSAKEINGIKMLSGRIDGLDMDTLRSVGEALREACASELAVGVLGSNTEGKAILVSFASDSAIKERGLQAGKLIGQIAKLIGGGGGGRPQLATAGGKQIENLDKALSSLANVVSELAN